MTTKLNPDEDGEKALEAFINEAEERQLQEERSRTKYGDRVESSDE